MSAYCYRYKNGPKRKPAEDIPVSEEEEKDEIDDKENQKISRVNNHVYFHAEVNRGSIFDLNR